MTTLRTVPVHEVVRRTFPRPPPEEKDHVAMATGRAIDGAVTQLGHELRTGRRPTTAAMQALAAELLDEGLAEAAVEVPAGERERILGKVTASLQAYRRSPIVGLARPRTHVLVINDEVGVYAQPDFWDGRTRFYEMKSYRAIPPPPDVALQLRLFQLAFPGLQAVLLCLDRHADPVTATTWDVPRPTDAETEEALRRALDVGREFGEPKVREYMSGPFVPYRVEPAPRAPDAPGPGVRPD